MQKNEGSKNSWRRQLQFGTIYDIFFVKHRAPTNTNVDFAEITKNIQVPQARRT
jgi:hypothetical protein